MLDRCRAEMEGEASKRVKLTEAQLREGVGRSATRADLWVSLLTAVKARDVAEIGVYRGNFAARLLRDCGSIATYYMVDPWRHLSDWNKPANAADDAFERFFHEAMEKTQAYAEKRVVLRGRTRDVIDRVPDEGLDFAYVDGDHTLRGITIDFVRLYPKVRDGGWIGGDDFSRSIWQHDRTFEPTLVFPYAVYFAEAVGARLYGLPHNQFLLEKGGAGEFEFVDLTGVYGETDLRNQLAEEPVSRRRDSGGRSLVARLRRRLRV